MRNVATTLAFVGLTMASCAAPQPVSAPTPPVIGFRACSSDETAMVKERFVVWNRALAQGQEGAPVVALYDTRATLLPTLEVGPYTKGHGIEQYFKTFVAKGPSGAIEESARTILCGDGVAVDSGLYTFTFKKGPPAKARYTYIYRINGKEWTIMHHHSSVEPPPTHAKK